MASDEQALVNDMLFEVESIYGGPPIKLVRGPSSSITPSADASRRL
jgi:hypothetical protein